MVKKIDPNYKKLDLTKPEIASILVSSYWDLRLSHVASGAWDRAIFKD